MFPVDSKCVACWGTEEGGVHVCWGGGGGVGVAVVEVVLKHCQCLSDLCGPRGRKTDAVCLAEESVLTLSVVFAEVESTFIQV